MPEFSPFKGIRYAVGDDLSSVLAPPYDVISPEEKDRLKALSEWNVIRLILPDDSPGSDRYLNARDTLRSWLRDGVLRKDPEPSYYVLRQVFQVDSRPVERFTVLGALELSPFEEGKVLPHEETLSGPKEDRRRLLYATGTNLSPIFGLLPDDSGDFLRWIRNAVEGARPDAVARGADGTDNSLFRVSSPEALATLGEIALRQPVLIADGHHRYETALKRKLELAPNDPSHPAGRILAAVGSMQDPGMLILPTHRVVKGTGRAGSLLRALEADFVVEKASLQRLEDLAAARDAAPPPAFGLVSPQGEFILSYRENALPEAAAPNTPEVFRRLDVAVLHHAMDKMLGIDRAALAAKKFVEYVRSVEEAAAAVRNGAECAFILRPVSAADVKEVAAAGLRMPQKSTYFHPKIPSGLVFRKAE